MYKRLITIFAIAAVLAGTVYAQTPMKGYLAGTITKENSPSFALGDTTLAKALEAQFGNFTLERKSAFFNTESFRCYIIFKGTRNGTNDPISVACQLVKEKTADGGIRLFITERLVEVTICRILDGCEGCTPMLSDNNTRVGCKPCEEGGHCEQDSRVIYAHDPFLVKIASLLQVSDFSMEEGK